MISHITIIFGQCQTGVNTRLTSCNRHVGRIGNQYGTIRQRTVRFRVDQLGEFLQNLRHLVSTLPAADIDDDIGITPLRQLMLRHGLSGTKAARNRCRSTLGNREQRIENTLPGNQRHTDRQSFCHRTSRLDRPFLYQRQLMKLILCILHLQDALVDIVFSALCRFNNRSIQGWRNHTAVFDQIRFRKRRKYLSGNNLISHRNLYCHIP